MTTIKQDMGNACSKMLQKPVNYAYNYGRLRGLIMTLEHYPNNEHGRFMLYYRVQEVIARMREIEEESE
jgi:hypothetical protein